MPYTHIHRRDLMAVMSTARDARRNARNRDPAIRSRDITPRHVSFVLSCARNGGSSEEWIPWRRRRRTRKIRQNPVGALRSRIDRIHIVDRKRSGAGSCMRAVSSYLPSSWLKVIFGTCLMDGISRFSAAKFSRRNSILDIPAN